MDFYGLSIPKSLEELVSPRNTALVIYDMQVGIVRQIANGQEITSRVARVLEAARRAGVRTFFTRHMSLPEPLMGAFQYRTAMAWQHVDSPEKVNPMFLRDTPAFQIVPELQPQPGMSEVFIRLVEAPSGQPFRMTRPLLMLGTAPHRCVLPLKLGRKG